MSLRFSCRKLEKVFPYSNTCMIDHLSSRLSLNVGNKVHFICNDLANALCGHSIISRFDFKKDICLINEGMTAALQRVQDKKSQFVKKHNITHSNSEFVIQLKNDVHQILSLLALMELGPLVVMAMVRVVMLW